MQQSRQKIFDKNNIDLQKQISLRNLVFNALKVTEITSLQSISDIIVEKHFISRMVRKPFPTI